MTTDKIHEITDRLEKAAGKKFRNAQAYYEGYVQACEDFSRNIRAELIEEASGHKEEE